MCQEIYVTPPPPPPLPSIDVTSSENDVIENSGAMTYTNDVIEFASLDSDVASDDYQDSMSSVGGGRVCEGGGRYCGDVTYEPLGDRDYETPYSVFKLSTPTTSRHTTV
jgi:hypothetical protein